jgi:mono/diheme cytochrome c family protein
MLRFGAKLSGKERQVLGVFWSGAPRSPAADPVKPARGQDPLAEYRAVLNSRCTGCHSLERVEKAMGEGRPLEELVEMMRQRGAIVTESEKNVLGTFWGEPFKPKPPE